MIIRAITAFFLMLFSFQLIAESSDEFRVAVASNFSIALKSLRLDFKKRTGNDFSISQASTGKLYAQIIYGAPYDFFFAADVNRPDLLLKKRLAFKSLVYAEGQLVFIVKKNSEFMCEDTLKQALRNSRNEKMAIANPKIAPYGLASQQFLKASNEWNRLSPNLVRGENILQTFQFVTSGGANAGFIAKSLLVSNDDLNSYCQWDVPKELYQPIKQKMVVLSRAKKNTAAMLFFHYLKSDSAKKIIKESGYYVE